MSHRKCELCGCYLDPGEKCDCQSVKERYINMVSSAVSQDTDGQFSLKNDVSKEISSDDNLYRRSDNGTS